HIYTLSLHDALPIFDKYLKGNIRLLEELYATDKKGFSQLSKKVCDSIFTDLRRHHTLDSLVQQYKEAIDYKGSLHWLSLLEGIADRKSTRLNSSHVK